MVDESDINTQIVNSVVHNQTFTGSQAPAQAFALLDLVMTETVGMGMHNAVNTQHNMQLMASSAVTAACARMINSQQPTTVDSPPAPQPSSPVPPLSASNAEAKIAAAEAEAENAAGTLSKAMAAAKQTMAALGKIGADSGADKPEAKPAANPAANPAEKNGDK